MGVIKHNPWELLYAISDDALDAAGYVLALDTSTGHVKKASSDDIPVGINFEPTLNPFNLTAEAGRNVAYIPIRSGYIVKVKKATGSGKSITKGDYVAVGSTDGVVEKWTPDTTDASTLLASLKKVVGVAIEDADETDSEVTIILRGV